MATRVGRLKHEALEACLWRGHQMSRFEWDMGSPSHYDAVCRLCGALVTVDTAPMPNETEISGEAVALDCPWRTAV
jgi:hypothetical protein